MDVGDNFSDSQAGWLWEKRTRNKVLYGRSLMLAATPASQETTVFAHQMLDKLLQMPPAYQTLVAHLFNGFNEAQIAEKSGHTIREVKSMRFDLVRMLGDVGSEESFPTGMPPAINKIPKIICLPAHIRVAAIFAMNIWQFLARPRRWVSEFDLGAAFKLYGDYETKNLLIPITVLEEIGSLVILGETSKDREYFAKDLPNKNKLYAGLKKELSVALQAT